MQAAIRFCCLAGLITLLAGCSKDNSSDPVLTLSTQNISLTGTILREQMEITTDAAWSISHDDAPWITVAPAEGPAGLSVVEITATAPEDYLPRTGSLSVRSANGLSRKVSITQTGAEAPAGSEQAALIALYNSLGGPKWREQTNWLSNKPVGEWKGVRTDADGHVVSLYFYANNLIGWLPEQIGDFPYLEQLTFSHDQISGSIPASIGKLTRLQTLDFTVNKLSGAIPNDITRLTELRTLALNDNKLGGTLPAELGKLTRLESLTLHNNSIRGEIPESITRLENLRTLNLSHNGSLNGNLPDGFERLTRLTSLSLQHNQLSGGLPEGFARLTQLTGLDVTFNRFSGTVPEAVTQQPNYDKWILSPQTSGYGFSNLGDNVESDDYSQDGQVLTYAGSPQNKGFHLIFMGDGFTSQDMGENGLYEQKMKQAIEALLRYEPYATYRNYLNTYIVKAVSKQNGVTQPGYARNTALSVAYRDESGSAMTAAKEKVYAYAAKVPGYTGMQNVVIAIIANAKRHAGTTYWQSDGNPNYAIGTLASTFETTLVHELGGHAIGLLADEYTGGATIPAAQATALRNGQQKGYYLNLDLTNDLSAIRWHEFIGQPGYDMVGAYEGGYQYAYGVWRPEQTSIMKQSSAPGAAFNAPSRALIVQRLLKAAGESYSFNAFLTKDVIPPTTKGTAYFGSGEESHTPPFLDGCPTGW